MEECQRARERLVPKKKAALGISLGGRWEEGVLAAEVAAQEAALKVDASADDRPPPSPAACAASTPIKSPSLCGSSHKRPREAPMTIRASASLAPSLPAARCAGALTKAPSPRSGSQKHQRMKPLLAIDAGGAVGSNDDSPTEMSTEVKVEDGKGTAIEPAEGGAADRARSTWLACDLCGKWRRVGVMKGSQIPKEWKCEQNPDSCFSSCDTPQELSNDAIDHLLGLKEKKRSKNKAHTGTIESGDGPDAERAETIGHGADRARSTWLACDLCGKWRRVGVMKGSQIPKAWLCEQNTDASFSSCDTPQELSNDAIDRLLGLLDKEKRQPGEKPEPSNAGRASAGKASKAKEEEPPPLATLVPGLGPSLGGVLDGLVAAHTAARIGNRASTSDIDDKNSHSDGSAEARTLHWHLANLEYGCAASLGNVSLCWWDQDDEHTLGGDHCIVSDGFDRLVQVRSSAPLREVCGGAPDPVLPLSFTTR
eukprot:scaffold285162_cov31-Tisochrysis_lutea.AAC.2